jgi:formylglycine-generating enzyme
MLTSLLLLALPAPAALQNSGADQAPAGLVEIPAGRTRVGQLESDAKKIIEEDSKKADVIGPQIGDYRADVQRFWIAPTEVTNEMYLRFVEETGAMPPASWVQLDREQRLAIIAKLKEIDKTASLSDHTLGVWWEENWQSGEYNWELLPSEATMPVGYISHHDARAYCKWAGLRLPTEEEWVRAARGDENDRAFPMGKFDATMIAHDATKPRDLAYKALPVSALANASSYGIFDLSGNHWEWTDSRYRALPKFRPFNVKTKKGKVDVAPNFDAASFVLKGGSFKNPGYACSIDVRVGILPEFRASILGFRVASSGVPGMDFARYSLDEISGALLGGLPEAVLALDKVVAVEKHRIVPNSEIEARRADPKNGLPASKLPAGYAVFDRADAVAMVPLAELNVKKGKMERTVEEEGPVAVGALFSTVALESASVLAGNYVLMYVPPQEAETLLDLGITLPEEQIPGNWKPKELKEGEVSIREVWPSVEGLTIKVNTPYLLLVDKERAATSAIELARVPREEKAKTANSSITFDLDKGYLNFQLSVPDASGNWAFIFNTPIVPRGSEGTMLNPSDWNAGPYAVIEKIEEEDKK